MNYTPRLPCRDTASRNLPRNVQNAKNFLCSFPLLPSLVLGPSDSKKYLHKRCMMIIRGSSSDDCLDLYFLKDLPCFDGDGLYDFLCHEHSLSSVSGMLSNYIIEMLRTPCVPLAIKTIMIVLFKILKLFYFKAIRSSWLTLN